MALRAQASTAALARSVVAPEAESGADERRWAQRKPRSLPAYILSQRLSASVPAIVRDLSSTGAKVEIILGRDTVVSSADSLPDKITLFMVSDEMEVDGTIAWRAGNFVGIRFSSASRPRPRPKAIRRKAK